MSALAFALEPELLNQQGNHALPNFVLACELREQQPEHFLEQEPPETEPAPGGEGGDALCRKWARVFALQALASESFVELAPDAAAEVLLGNVLVHLAGDLSNLPSSVPSISSRSLTSSSLCRRSLESSSVYDHQRRHIVKSFARSTMQS